MTHICFSKLSNSENKHQSNTLVSTWTVRRSSPHSISLSWWRHHMEKLPTILALWEGNPPVTGGFPSQKASSVELGYCLWSTPEHMVEKKQWKCRWFETPWRSCDVTVMVIEVVYAPVSSLAMVRWAARLAVYVAVMTMTANHQKPWIRRPERHRGEISVPWNSR